MKTLLLLLMASCSPATPWPPPTNLRIGTLAPKNSLYHRQLMERRRGLAQGPGRRQVSGLSGWQPGRRGRHGAPHAHRPVAGRPAVGRRSARDRAVDCRAAEHAADVPQLGGSRLRARKNAAGMEKKFLDKGFVILAWGDAGWVRFFSKQPACVRATSARA
jgi:TRAP-type transport system periplasmic protein